MRTLHFTIPEEYGGVKLENFLRREAKLSARLICKLKHYEEGIQLNGVHARTVDIPKAGDTLTLNIQETPTDTLPSGIEVEVLYEDEDLILYNKPAGMPCHQAKRYQQDTLANVYAAHCAGHGISPTFRCINRLDRNTSGAVVVAKNQFVADRINGKIEKSYLAIVCGSVSKEQGVIEAPIRRLNDRHTMRIVSPDGSPAKTVYQVLYKWNTYTLVRLYLYTGRTHQIRVHMAHIGHPLAGDDMYGGDLDLIDRQALHCEKAEFIHPFTGEKLCIQAPLSQDMQKILCRL